MSKIKGALLLEYARLIRDNKDRNWKKYLTEEDLKTINDRILPNSWYPLEIYERAGNAIFNEIGQGKFANAWIWGKFVIEDLGNRFYHNLVRFQDPAGAVGKCRTFLSQWFQFDTPDFQAIEVLNISSTKIKVTVRYEHQFPFFEAYVHQLGGTLERIVELNGGKETKVTIIEHDWKANNPYAVLQVTWQ